jgi:hypothetical protein
MTISNGCLLKHLYCYTNTAFHSFTATLPKTLNPNAFNISLDLTNSVFCEFIFWVYCPERPKWLQSWRFRTSGRRYSGTSELIAEVYTASKTSVSAERRPSSSFRFLTGWFRQRGVHKNVVFPNYKQKRVIFILGELNWRLQAPVIPSRSNVGPADASVNITSITVKVYTFERETNRVPCRVFWRSPLSYS